MTGERTPLGRPWFAAARSAGSASRVRYHADRRSLPHDELEKDGFAVTINEWISLFGHPFASRRVHAP